MSPMPTSATKASTIGILEMLRPSAICSGMLAPAMSSTTATKKKNLRYRNRPMMTAIASTASSVVELMQRLSSRYSRGTRAPRAVAALPPSSYRTPACAASNADRPENGYYIDGKRRLREIDRRVRFLIKRLENAEVVQSAGRDTDQIFFGARVRLKGASGEKTITILGLDEVDPAHGVVSWISPIARALIKARAGD